MEQEGSRNGSHIERQEITTRKTVKKSLANSPRHRKSSQQQPGRFLCVDTRRDQVYAPKVRPNSSYTHNFSSPSTRSKHFNKNVSKNLQPKKNFKAVQNRTVQPDSHCKFKTTLAIEYVRDLLDENATNSRPISRRNSLKRNGQLKPLGAEHPNLEPNVTKCLGIQNDRQKKTLTLEDGLEVREELVTPDIARFSSATKRISQNTLTIDLRKLSLVDPSETIASDNSVTDEERRQETDFEVKMKNPKSTIIYKNSERHWSDFIDDNDQDIEDTIDHAAVGSNNRHLDYDRYNQGEPDYMSDEYVHDNSTVKYRDDYSDFIDHEKIDNGDVNYEDDNYISDDVDDHIDDIHDDPVSDTAVSNDYTERNLTESNSLTLNEKTNSNISEGKSKPEEMKYSQLPIGSHNSTTLLPKPSMPSQDFKTTDENKSHVHVECNVEFSNTDELQHTSNAEPLPYSDTSTKPLLNESTPDHDSIHVKDIWKALVDGGYAISREEVSKYKVNSKKRRIKSAPARRRPSQSTSTLPRDVPTRARSAINRDGETRSRKECFTELNEECDSQSTTKNPKFVGFVQEHASDQKVKQGQISLSNEQSSLEVVAVSKPVTKILRKKNIPLVPPLNFQINTIPKSGHFFYFAYGLNMNQKRLEIQLRCKTGVRYWGLLFGFKLLFNKKASAEGGVGFPNVVHEPGFSVEGCVYELSLECLPLLDTCVGFPKHYSRIVIPVWMCNSLNADEHGVAQHCVPAVVYVAQDEWVASDPTTLDTSFTLKQCVLGTDLLTSNYQTFLESSNKKTASNEYLM